MVVINMDGPTRDQVLRLMEQKDRIERQIQEHTQVLERNNIGMNEPLVDNEGFPRNDIDVYRVRHARHNIICLQNDHKALMKQIERGLHHLHSRITGHPEGSINSEPATVTSNSHMSMEVDRQPSENYSGLSNGVAVVTHGTSQLDIQARRPIALVNYVSPDSPAEQAGFCVGDELLSFGSINPSNYQNLQQIAEVMNRSVNTNVHCRVRRNGSEILEIIMTPRPWGGRGLAGFNIINP